MKKLSIFALYATLATYFLIFVGGLVRVAGAGLGCPDWPKCFGRWIPPTHVSQLPSDFDPALFNFTLAWIEYINRLVGVVVGLLIAITAIIAIVKVWDQKRILWASVAAAVLTAFQGWLGSVVVESLLSPIIVSVHMLIALIIVSLLIYVWQETQRKLHGPDPGIYPVSLSNLLKILWILSIVQIVIGTRVRGSIEVLSEKYPLLYGIDLLNQVGMINYFHTFTGIIVAFFTGYIVVSYFSKSKNISRLVRQSLILMLILVFIQIMIGMALWLFGIPALAQLFHLWVAALFIGFILIVYTSTKPVVQHEK